MLYQGDADGRRCAPPLIANPLARLTRNGV
jgi:hypothetical protein